MQQLTMIILACTLHSSDFSKFSNACQECEEILNEELQETAIPYSCMMKSPIYISQFMEKHPGMAPKRWTCKYAYPSKKI